MAHETKWWACKPDSGDIHKKLLPYARAVDEDRAPMFDRFVKYAALYDPNDQGAQGDVPRKGADGYATHNLVASNVDSGFAAIAATEVRTRLLTDDGDWSDQRRARHLEWYAAGLGKLIERSARAREAFKDCEIKGTGLVKVYVDWSCKDIKAERVLADDILVDRGECRAGRKPRQLAQRRIVDKDELCAKFPEFETEIESAANKSSLDPDRYWAGYRPVDRDEVVVIEAWYLPRGKKGTDYYQAGMHAICVEGADLFVEEYHKHFFPFARFVWSERISDWYGIGLAERIAPHQRRLNKLDWQQDKLIDRYAMPTTYVRLADMDLQVKTWSPLGAVTPYTSDPPITVTPQSVSPDLTARRLDVKEEGYEETGMSRLAATSRKPAGLESGAALREYRDQTTQRFSQQEKMFELGNLEIDWLALDCAKDLGADAPVIQHRVGRYKHKFEWSKVDVSDLRVQMSAASDLPRTAAGRQQLAIELAQAGVISTDSALETMTDLDITAELSLYKAAQESIDGDLESIIEGETVVPEGYDNLDLIKKRGIMRYHKERKAGCPEDLLEGIRQYVVQAASIVTMGTAGAPLAQPGAAPPMDPAMAGPAGSMPAGPPQAAFASQAMDLAAG